MTHCAQSRGERQRRYKLQRPHGVRRCRVDAPGQQSAPVSVLMRPAICYESTRSEGTSEIERR